MNFGMIATPVADLTLPHTIGVLDRLGLLPKLRASSFPLRHSVRFATRNGKESSPFL